MSPSLTAPHTSRHGSGFISLAKLFLAVLLHAATTYASPLFRSSLHTIHTNEEPEPKPASDPSLYAYLGTAIALVLLGGAFAGLTIALMGQDEVYLQVISTSGEGAEKKNAAKVLRLLKRGKHWVLVTLLVGNVITNETLPLVLDRSIGGGYAAAISSTVLVIVFGEIVPQSICVRFGLPIGALMAPVVLAFMWVFAPITWPIAKLLDYLLGEDHGTVYKKSGLKTLVTLHKTMGTAPGERLNEDEVAIISGVLDLKSKPVGSILTPMNDVFTLSADARLDERMIEIIMREGYSRIPVHNPENKGDFVGMLLVKMLISYDPEDAKRVHEFALATLPETRPDTSCLDIINFFQEGKSHMVLVSDHPAQSYGALGVVTLEDVIEELIGEEIIDESDIFVDVHKGLRRLQPAPTHRHNRFKAQRGQFYEDNNSQAVGEEHQLATDGTVTKDDAKDDANDSDTERAIKNAKRGSTASIDRRATFMMRRPSNTSVAGSEVKPVQMNQNNPEFRSQMRNLGPSNIASRPRQTRINTVKVKPGVSTIPENKDVAKQMDKAAPESPAPDRSDERPVTTPLPTEAQEGIGQDYLESNHDAKDGVQALQQGYGTWDNKSPVTGRSKDDDDQHDPKSQGGTGSKEDETDPFDRAAKIIVGRTDSHSTLGSLHSADSGERGHRRKRTTARSGSITENIVERDGVKKLVLAASSSSEDEEAVQGQADKSRSRGPSHQGRNNYANGKSQASHSQASENGHDDSQTNGEGNSNGKSKKKKRPNRHKKKKEGGGGKDGDENTPLLSRD